MEKPIKITCPSCRFSKEIPFSSIPASAVNATCPQCAHRFPYAKPSAIPFDQTLEKDHQEAVFSVNTSQGVPWETRKDFGLLPALLLSVVRCLFNPQSSFRALPKQGGSTSALWYLLLLVSFQMVMLFFWDVSGVYPLIRGADGNKLSSFGLPWSAIIPLMMPFIFIVLPLIMAIILELSLRLVGVKPHGKRSTLRVLFYGSTPSIFLIIPLIGFWISLFWCLWTWTTAIKEVNRITYWRVFPAMTMALLIITMGTGLFFYSTRGLF